MGDRNTDDRNTAIETQNVPERRLTRALQLMNSSLSFELSLELHS